jgi:hypothetical protein
MCLGEGLHELGGGGGGASCTWKGRAHVGDGVLFSCRQICDVLTETSPVPESSLQPFQPLEWNISPPVARDIQVARDKLEK